MFAYGSLALQQVLPCNHLVIVVDPNTARFASGVRESLANGARVDVIELPVAGEAVKSRWGFDYIVSALAGTSFERRASSLVAVGGGTIMDLTGFVAATYMRGVSVVMVPTTLLAMVDAAIGGKTGINTEEGKHLLGAFHSPDAVYVDPAFLESLGERHYRAAFGELLKIALICGSEDFIVLLESNVRALLGRDPEILRQVILEAIRVKLQFLEQDWLESSLDRLLNLGHEIAHALEASCGFDDSVLLHGEAVAIGAVTASVIAADRDLAPSTTPARVAGLVRSLMEVPVFDAGELSSHLQIITRIRGGNTRVVLPGRAIGSARVYHDVSIPELEAGLARAVELLS